LGYLPFRMSGGALIRLFACETLSFFSPTRSSLRVISAFAVTHKLIAGWIVPLANDVGVGARPGGNDVRQPMHHSFAQSRIDMMRIEIFRAEAGHSSIRKATSVTIHVHG